MPHGAPNNCGDDGLPDQLCHLCKVVGDLLAPTPLPTHHAGMGETTLESRERIAPVLAQCTGTVGSPLALTIGRTRLWAPTVSETTHAASTSLTARRGRQRRTRNNTNHRHAVRRLRCTASACAPSSAATPIGAPARAPRFGRTFGYVYVSLEQCVRELHEPDGADT